MNMRFCYPVNRWRGALDDWVLEYTRAPPPRGRASESSSRGRFTATPWVSLDMVRPDQSRVVTAPSDHRSNGRQIVRVAWFLAKSSDAPAELYKITAKAHDRQFVHAVVLR